MLDAGRVTRLLEEAQAGNLELEQVKNNVIGSYDEKRESSEDQIGPQDTVNMYHLRLLLDKEPSMSNRDVVDRIYQSLDFKSERRRNQLQTGLPDSLTIDQLRERVDYFKEYLEPSQRTQHEINKYLSEVDGRLTLGT